MALAAVTPTPATVAANSRPKAIVPDATPTPAPVVRIAEATALPVRPKPTYATNAPPNVSAPQPRSAAPSKTAASEREKGIQSSPSPRLVERLDQRGLPDLVVVRTAWHPNADRRSVKIRLEATDEILTLREGDAVGRLVVQTISPSAVLFKAGEVEIRRRVGEPRSGG
ncbi:MAG TPA: hypothetical protein EYQ83_19215 [Acidobacteria bacterium]|nr:hypothetical protein [Acidobacteriota bacterium]